MMRRILMVGAAVAVAVGMSQPSHAAPRTETYAYVAGNGDIGSLNCDGNLKVTETTLGGTCFDILLGETSLAFVASDATGEAISMSYSFKDGAGDDMSGYPQVCGGADLAIPVGAQSFVVYYDTALSALSPCGGTPGTTGTTTATYG